MIPEKKIISSLALPMEPEGLAFLASNFYYSWDRRVREVFPLLDADLWEKSNHNPITLLKALSPDKIEELRINRSFISRLEKSVEIQINYIAGDSANWFRQTPVVAQSKDLCVAYFSMEFGVTSFLKIYSGGLGVLSGDHLKSVSDLGLPLVGIGLFYARGYFTQGLNADGWQVEQYPTNKPDELPIEIVRDDSQKLLIFSVPLANREIKVRAWKASIGRISLYLLDTNIPELNSSEDCEITGELYGGDSDNRIKQEIRTRLWRSEIASIVRAEAIDLPHERGSLQFRFTGKNLSDHRRKWWKSHFSSSAGFDKGHDGLYDSHSCTRRN